MKKRTGVMILAIVCAAMVLDVQAEFIVLTDAFTVEVFDNTGAKTSTINLTGSGAVSGTNLISATYGNFRGNGNELMVLRDSGHIEYYEDPLAASGSLSRLAYQPLEDAGRVIAGITTVVGGKNLAAVANPGTSAGTYGYEYDGSIASGVTLKRISTPSVGGGFHAPYVSLATGPDLNAAPGQDWALLGSDGWVEIFSDAVPGGGYERVSYFNAGGSAVEIEGTDHDRYAVLYDDNTVKFWTFSGTDTGSSIALDTTSTLTGFIPVAIPASVSAVRSRAMGQATRGMEIPLPEVDPRGEWFQQAKLGVFLHWGMYAVDGYVSNRLNYPTRPDVFIPWDIYFAQAEKFKAENYDPVEWAKIFREAGARYAVITTKHHDGLALWDSQAPGALTTVNGTAAGRDLLAPFVEAMRTDNMPVGLYFSVSDWHHPDYASMKPRPGSPQTVTSQPLSYAETDQPERWKKFQSFLFAQIKELMEFNPDIWWFDGIWERTHENWRGPEIAEMIARRNPSAILGRGWQFDVNRALVRYQTPEQAIPLTTPKGLWELCQTTNGSWAYNPADTKWKSTGTLVQLFTEVIARGGNLLLNVGPKADGTLPEESIVPMLEMGAWIKRNAEAIYPTFGGEQAGTSFKCFFGPSTVSMDGKTLYLFVDSFPEHGIQLRGIHTVPASISVVSTGEAIEVQWFGGNGAHPRTYTIMPPKNPDPLCTVIRLEFNQVIRIDRKAGELQEGEL